MVTPRSLWAPRDGLWRNHLTAQRFRADDRHASGSTAGHLLFT